MKEISEERMEELISKWGHILNCTEPLSGKCTTAILIESQERWHSAAEVKAATPDLQP